VARGFNGYANSAVLRVNYHRNLHKEIASKIADATLRFYREGLKVRTETEAESWRPEFLERWNEWIARLAPIVKDDCWCNERVAGDEPVRSLFLAQRLQRINLSRPARRHITGEQRHCC